MKSIGDLKGEEKELNKQLFSEIETSKRIIAVNQGTTGFI